jgi:hypothetical protein
MIEVCPLCGDDYDVTAEGVPAGDAGSGLRPFRCRHPQHGGEGFVWFAAPAGLSGKGGGGADLGFAEELGLYDLLPTLLVRGEPWVEYGIVERRLREAEPDVFAELVERYGHIETHGSKTYTASAFIARTLGDLTRPPRGPLVASCGTGPATGFWSYNHQVFYWALPPGPPVSDKRTFVEWAQIRGWDPAKP